jgi:hypothetical protein
MGNREDYEQKLAVISAISEDQIKAPHNIPVNTYIQEADTLYHWAREDQAALTAVGLCWDLVADLPLRCGALIEAEARWQVQRHSGKSAAQQEWDSRAPLAYELRNQLLHDFRFAFRKDPDLTAAVKALSGGNSRSKMIQTLNDLSVLGQANRGLLSAIHFDMSLLDRAAQTAADMARLLARASKGKPEYHQAKKIRDQAYTHLSEAVDEIRQAGQYAFRRQKDRAIGYRSHHLRRTKKAHPS